jgi:ABC-type uncharacterized transport system substrate-binding protein
MAEIKRILAVAVGPSRQTTIRGKSVANNVRPYIRGLIEGLARHDRRPGSDFEIDYRERPQLDRTGARSNAAFKPNAEKPYDLIFGMSTTVVRAARRVTKKIPIVGVVSDSGAEGLRAGNITGISARRSQSAGQCFESFLATVPTLREVRALHKPGYGPSERALKLVKAAAKRRGVKLKAVAVRTREDIVKKIKAMPKRDRKKPAELGLFVLPADVALGQARRIVQLAQAGKRIPAFFPITDCVTRKANSALGGYGVPQRRCGDLMADYVAKILWKKAKPSALKVTAAGGDAFEWLVSSQAAKALNISLPHLI